ncbi:hypothetical protein Bca52824_054374 [Brassica carinata]|uniref:Uncharacterized protein n=1 Tax=Brassica carinata TaxID=52824 RepID=A0A8X7ULS1_BRACI|nr:hypothetical protein Bca52824_054374 [Brassica carinata]
MSLVPETDYSPANRRPEHEKFLMVYLTLDEPKMLEEQKRFIRDSRLVSPQDYTSMLKSRRDAPIVHLQNLMHRDATTGSSRRLGAITTCQRESLAITGQTPHVLLSCIKLERCIYDVRRRRTKTEPPSHHRRTDRIHTVVSRKPLEEPVMSPESRDIRRSYPPPSSTVIQAVLAKCCLLCYLCHK